jgi:HEAT repeat protein
VPRRLAAMSLAVLLLATTAVADDENNPSYNGRTMSEWMTMLREDSLPRKRRAAVIALGQLAAENRQPNGPIERILPALARALRADANAGVRSQAAIVLAQQPPEHAGLFLAELAETLRIERESEVRRELAVALGRFGRLSRAAVVPLVETLTDPTAATRAAAAEALGRIGPEARQAAAALIPLLQDSDPAVRQAAAFALGRVDPDDPAPVSAALIAALQREQQHNHHLSGTAVAGTAGVWAVRRTDFILELIVSLGLLGDRSPEVVQAVAGWLRDPAVDVRRQAGLSLGKFGPAARPAAEALREVFESDPDKLVRIYALHTLTAAFGSEAHQLISTLTARLKADSDFEVRVAIADELGALGPAGNAAIPALREAQRDPQIKVREAAGAAIRNIQRPPDPAKP